MNALAFALLLAASAPPAADTVAITRLRYDGGGDWYANPSSLPNLLAAIRTRTGIPVTAREAQVSLLDPSLPDHPYLYMTGHGNVAFSPAERAALRAYLLGGGFLHADDNYGLDESFRREMSEVFPDVAMTEIPSDHPVFHVSTIFRKDCRRSMSTMGALRRRSVSSTGGDWSSSIPTRRTWAMAGRTKASTTIRRKSGSRLCAWA
jgi:hypothetical protein